MESRDRQMTAWAVAEQELKTAEYRRQKRLAVPSLARLKWLMAFASGPAHGPGVRSWNNRLCYQAVWLRSDSRTCTLSFVFCCGLVRGKLLHLFQNSNA
jgi:hypothetical protein